LYVVWNKAAQGIVATGGYCVLNVGPRFGEVKFNVDSLAYNPLKGTNIEFDRNLEYTIH
jgi:hypothetical protein